MLLRTLMLSLILAATGATGAAKIDTTDENWRYVDADTRALCLRVQDTRVPATHWPSVEERKALQGCESEKFYYGIGVPVDAVKARHCALLEAERGDNGAFAGKSLLMMLYANGRGVARDIDLAQRLACESWFAPAEAMYRQQHLEKMRGLAADAPAPPAPSQAYPRAEAFEATRALGEDGTARDPDAFDVCDDITSGVMQGACMALEERRDAALRDQRLFDMRAKWSPREQASFDGLYKAFEAYAEARSMNELDLGGTARSMFIVAEEARLRNLFTAQIAQFEDKRWFPKFTAADLAASDKELNATYEKIQAVPKRAFDESGFGPWGTVNPAGIRAAQRAWLAYRDAWVAFGAVKYPHVPADAWRTWQTRERLKLLREFTAPGK